MDPEKDEEVVPRTFALEAALEPERESLKAFVGGGVFGPGDLPGQRRRFGRVSLMEPVSREREPRRPCEIPIASLNEGTIGLNHFIPRRPGKRQLSGRGES